MKEDKPNIIYLQDEDVSDNYEGVTWCFHKIDDGDSKYIKEDYLISLIDELIEKHWSVKEALTELKNKIKE